MARPDPPGKNYPDITKMKKLDYNANVSENVKAIRKAMQDARMRLIPLTQVSLDVVC